MKPTERLNKTATFRVSDDEYVKLAELAKRANLPVGFIIRQAIRAYLDSLM